MFKGIRQKFHDKAVRREEEKTFKAKVVVLTDAIRQGDNRSFSALFDGIKDSPFYSRYTAESLLVEAIKKDNEPAFSAVIDTCSDPNIWFATAAAGGYKGGPVATSNEHILGLAIRSGSKNIALAMARNEKISVDRSGYSQMIYTFPFKPKTTPYKSLPELAKEKGMPEVEKVLKERLAVEQDAKAKAAPPTGP